MPDFSGTAARPKQVAAKDIQSDPTLEIKPADDATIDDNDATPLPSMGETSAPKYQPVSFQDHAAELRAVGVSWDEITDYLKSWFPSTPQFALPDVTVKPDEELRPPAIMEPAPDATMNERVRKATAAKNIRTQATVDPVVDENGIPVIAKRFIDHSGHPDDVIRVPPQPRGKDITNGFPSTAPKDM